MNSIFTIEARYRTTKRTTPWEPMDHMYYETRQEAITAMRKFKRKATLVEEFRVTRWIRRRV